MRRAVRLFARGFLLQALFNPRGQQRGGLAWIVGQERRAAAGEACREGGPCGRALRAPVGGLHRANTKIRT